MRKLCYAVGVGLVMRRSPSTAAFSIFRSARAFASTASLSARLLRLACCRSSSAAWSFDRASRPHDNFTTVPGVCVIRNRRARSGEIGDVLKVMAPN
jgi:hypothetical protein